MSQKKNLFDPTGSIQVHIHKRPAPAAEGTAPLLNKPEAISAKPEGWPCPLRLRGFVAYFAYDLVRVRTKQSNSRFMRTITVSLNKRETLMMARETGTRAINAKSH